MEKTFTISGVAKEAASNQGVEGAFVNLSDLQVFWSYNGITQINNSDDKHDWAVNFDVGYYLIRQLTPNIRARVGYEFWYIYQLALAPEQVQGLITTTTGRIFRWLSWYMKRRALSSASGNLPVFFTTSSNGSLPLNSALAPAKVIGARFLRIGPSYFRLISMKTVLSSLPIS